MLAHGGTRHGAEHSGEVSDVSRKGQRKLNSADASARACSRLPIVHVVLRALASDHSRHASINRALATSNGASYYSHECARTAHRRPQRKQRSVFSPAFECCVEYLPGVSRGERRPSLRGRVLIRTQRSASARSTGILGASCSSRYESAASELHRDADDALLDCGLPDLRQDAAPSQLVHAADDPHARNFLPTARSGLAATQATR